MKSSLGGDQLETSVLFVSCTNDIINSPIPLSLPPHNSSRPVPLPFPKHPYISNHLSALANFFWVSVRGGYRHIRPRPRPPGHLLRTNPTCLLDDLLPPHPTPRPARDRPPNNVAGKHIGEHQLQQRARTPALEHDRHPLHRKMRIHLRVLPERDQDGSESTKGMFSVMMECGDFPADDWDSMWRYISRTKD